MLLHRRFQGSNLGNFRNNHASMVIRKESGFESGAPTGNTTGYSNWTVCCCCCGIWVKEPFAKRGSRV